jgi:hypothetical protein
MMSRQFQEEFQEEEAQDVGHGEAHEIVRC